MPVSPNTKQCFKLLLNQFEADDVFSEFQHEDHKDKDMLKPSKFMQCLNCLLGPDHDIELSEVAEEFTAKKDQERVDYVKFCQSLEDAMDEKVKEEKEIDQTENEDATDAPQTSGSRSRTRRRRHSKPKSNITKRAIRVDQRLEKLRILKTAIRHKILHGVKHLSSQKDGFNGIRDVICQLDTDGGGLLVEGLFIDALLEHMKLPLTAKEMKYLTNNLRNKKEPKYIDYEHIGLFLCVDSEEEASTSGEETKFNKKSQEPRLGSGILNIERELQAHLLQSVPSDLATLSCRCAPRSIFTGAEKFVEACEVFDPLGINALSELDYAKVMEYCGFNLTKAQLQAILSKFPRDSDGNINYNLFLERYGQKHGSIKQQKQMKTILQRLAMDPTRDASEIIIHFKKQLDKIDRRVTGIRSGLLSKKDFLSALTSHESLRWPSKDVNTIIPLFCDGNEASHHVHYDRFLKMLENCTNIPTSRKCNCSEGTSSGDVLKKRLRAFLYDTSRGQSNRGYDIALHAFESADKMRNPNSGPTGLLQERDFFTVLRTIGTGIAPAEKLSLSHILTQANALTANGVLYLVFLKYFESIETNTPPVNANVPPHLRNISVGSYLAEYATPQECQNFEKIMETFSSLGAVPDKTHKSSELVYRLGPVLKVKLQFFT
ncbi:hypothetical protein THRCLA_23320 [Thraustotheca clavata]|uniref:Calmodulin n=1 Tax=Thraustotheca clavata TaxID=74557 RepID=A0A1V9Y7G2_9STRA|nr:hypothetical protein THRCLA_23320 [Thraustotheca clavata]